MLVVRPADSRDSKIDRKMNPFLKGYLNVSNILTRRGGKVTIGNHFLLLFYVLKYLDQLKARKENLLSRA